MFKYFFNLNFFSRFLKFCWFLLTRLWWHTPLVLAVGGRGRWISEVEANLVYRVCSRQGLHRETLSQKTQNKNLFYLCEFCLHLCMFIICMLEEVRRSCCSLVVTYGCEAIVWVLGMQLRSSRRAASTPSSWAITPGLFFNNLSKSTSYTWCFVKGR